MEILKVQADLQDEIRRLQAIKVCLHNPENVELILNGLDLAIASLEKDIDLLEKV